MKIKRIKARQILDSRGNPTVEVDILTSKGLSRASVPSGASTGKHEAHELRDNKKEYHGKSVHKAVKNINKIIARKLRGIDCTKQEYIDHLMIDLDSTDNKSKLGANAILAVSVAVCKAGARCLNIPVYKYISKLSKQKPKMPIPMMNVINGGLHAGIKHDIQEHLIIPTSAKTFSQGLRMCTETYHVLKDIIKHKGYSTLTADEGGFVPDIELVEKRLALIKDAIAKAGYKNKIKLALDCAASDLFVNGEYSLPRGYYSDDELVRLYKKLSKEYNVISIEDGLREDDWEAWQEMTKKLHNLQIIGDDLLVTNPLRIEHAIKINACNALLLKINQIGTITEAITAHNLAKKAGWNIIVSHRSGETEDSFIADLAVGLGAKYCKFGAPARSDRNAKYNQLLRIEEQL